MTDQSLLAAWGVTTTAGYLATHAMGVAGTEVLGLGVFGSIVAVWALLMLPPVGMTVAIKARGRTDSHHWVWVGLVAAALAVNVGVVVGGGGHTHDGSGHGGAAEGASGHGEPGHHAGPSASERATGAASDGPAAAGSSGEDGHAHPDGGHGESAGPPDAGEGDPGGHAHPDGGHGGPGDADPQEAPGDSSTSSGSANAPSSGGAEGGGHGGGETDGGLVDAAALQHAAYFHLWFLIGALGFAYSAAVAHGGARKALYGTAALLNAAMVLALVAVPDARGVAFLVAAAIQGLPMLVDLPLRTRAERAAA
ncbi:MAG: hypothetical protein AAGJ11_17735 [Bacteroidota bacterium]